MSLPFFQQSPSGIAVVQALSPAAWFRFGVGLTDDGAGLCSNWSDQSGNGRDLKATLTARPTIQADKSLLFDGVANFMKCDAFTLNQPETIYFLGKQVTWSAAGSFLTDGGASTAGGILQRTATPNIAISAGTALGSNSGLAVGSYGVVAAVFNGASSAFQINSGATTTGDAGAGNMGGLTVGARGDNGAFTNIQVKEVIVYAAAHDAATRSRVISYLGSVGAISV